MKVLVINSGSSSLKYQFIETEKDRMLTKGLVERIGHDSEMSFLSFHGQKIKMPVEAKNHDEALHLVLDKLTDKNHGFISALDEIDAIGHRVVHGGEAYSSSVLIDDDVIAKIEKYAELAPLHNPPNLAGIIACKEILPNTPQVAVFDTAFHQTMPTQAYLYAIPYEYYEKYGIRRYGFHGTSHRYVSIKAAEFLNIPFHRFNAITCHLGNGSSITAIKAGQVIDTSMGFTPLEGVIMGTRSGSLDPAILPFLMEKEGLSSSEMNTILNKKSGLLGLSGISNDLREIWDHAKNGEQRAINAREALFLSIRRYIGAYMAELGRVDAIIFTAGIGENDWEVRLRSVNEMEALGVALDENRNRETKGVISDISAPHSKTKILMVPTNEELMIAMETDQVVKK